MLFVDLFVVYALVFILFSLPLGVGGWLRFLIPGLFLFNFFQAMLSVSNLLHLRRRIVDSSSNKTFNKLQCLLKVKVDLS